MYRANIYELSFEKHGGHHCIRPDQSGYNWKLNHFKELVWFPWDRQRGQGKHRLYTAGICDHTQPEAQASWRGHQRPPIWLLLHLCSLSRQHPILCMKPNLPASAAPLCTECTVPKGLLGESNPWLYVTHPEECLAEGKGCGRIRHSCSLLLSLLVAVVKCLLIEKSGRRKGIVPWSQAYAELPHWLGAALLNSPEAEPLTTYSQSRHRPFTLGGTHVLVSRLGCLTPARASWLGTPQPAVTAQRDLQRTLQFSALQPSPQQGSCS